MRRAILLLLALALLLSGCVRKQAQPSLQELLKLDELSSLAAPPAEEPQGPQTAGDPLPSTGVWVDESVYTPRAQAAAKYTRPEGDLCRYMPGQGTVYPYCAGENQYGFCTADGTLVTDPIFSEMTCVGDNDSNVPILSARAHIEMQDKASCCAIAMDGSFMTDSCYTGFSCHNGQLRCTRSDMYMEYDLLDLQGNLLISKQGEDVTIAPGAIDDLLPVSYLREDSGDLYIEYVYYNPDGERVLGPYRMAGPFSDGLACVSEDNLRYGYIDRTGSWVLEPIYTRWCDFQDGRATPELNDSCVLIDTEGNILLETSRDSYLNRWGDFYTAETDSYLYLYDRDGSELYYFDGNWGFLTQDVLCASYDGGYALRSLDDPDRVVQLSKGEMSTYPTEGAIYVDGRFLKGYVTDDHEHRVRYWVSEDLQHTGYAPLPDYVGNYWWEGSASVFCRPYAEGTLTDLMTGETYYPVFEQSRVLIFTGDGELVWTCSPNVHLAIIGGRLGVVTDRDCTYYEQDGSVSFRFPFFVLPDD